MSNVSSDDEIFTLEARPNTQAGAPVNAHVRPLARITDMMIYDVICRKLEA